jgi:phospholipid/cholesterol/gamma-HCH transport system substrate-binding protein
MERDRTLELKVGIFVFIGLAAIAGFVVQFGRLGEGFKTYYAVTVRFKDASGLLKGSDVLFSGAKIGKVATGPRLLHEGEGVAVALKIYDYVRIPAGSKFTVGSSGLLGDRFVNVAMPQGPAKEYLPKNTTVEGARETGIDDLTREGNLLIQDLRGTVQNINGTFTRLNTEALSPETMQNLRSSVDHLNETTTTLSQSSKKLDGVIDKADATMGSAKKDADELQGTIAEARKTFASATQLLRDATKGNGLLAALISDSELARDLRALVANLRAHGVLFYRDSAARTEPAPPRPPAARRSPER